MTHSELKEKVKLLPYTSGIYMMKDKNGKIIYVGKSKCLHNRVAHYFQPISSLDPKTAKLSVNISDFECIYTASEAEALILENELIKRHTPKYNIKLKDAKTYPYIKISSSNPYPEISISRTRKDDRSQYYGPYVSSKNANDIIDIVCKTFGVASCGKSFEYGKRVCRPCLFFHMGQCIGPCSGKVTSSEYRDIFFDIEHFLKGNYSEVVSDLRKKMNDSAGKMDFENAAKFRDRITALTKLKEHQNIITDPDKEYDVFGFYVDETSFSLCVVFIRNGKVIDKEDYIFSSGEILDDYELSAFIERFYENCGHVPKNVLISYSISGEEIDNLTSVLSNLAGYKVNVLVPERGEKKIYVEMAKRNAAEAVRQKKEMIRNDEKTLVKFASLLRLEVVPQRIEAYDISNNGKNDIYAGMIVLEDGRFKKSHYRVFSIKDLNDKQDDYASMRETLKRRLRYLCDDTKESNESFSTMPDLLLIDGGAGHVNVVRDLVYELGLNIAVIGMVKDDHHKTRTLTDGQNEISLAKEFEIYNFIYGIQEEVHRFTFSKMDSSRNSRVKQSVLEKIDGIGKTKAGVLLKRFKSIQNIKNASCEDLASLPGINIELAMKIKEFLNK